jgi:hypothetical protein
MSNALREARLREQYVRLYPGLTPGTWLPAREVAEHIVDVVRREGGRLGVHGRIMADEHFDFRGGERAAAEQRSPNARREERGEA